MLSLSLPPLLVGLLVLLVLLLLLLLLLRVTLLESIRLHAHGVPVRPHARYPRSTEGGVAHLLGEK